MKKNQPKLEVKQVDYTKQIDINETQNDPLKLETLSWTI